MNVGRFASGKILLLRILVTSIGKRGGLITTSGLAISKACRMSAVAPGTNMDTEARHGVNSRNLERLVDCYARLGR